MFLSNQHIAVESLNEALFREKGISVFVLRADTINPVVSGNKWFKLYYFLEQAQQSSHRQLITFGGAWSNHLVATAYACQMADIKSIGIVRGEAPTRPSQTLRQCAEMGMQLQFISREHYRDINDPAFLTELQQQYGAHILVPEGGYHPLGAKGAALMQPLVGLRPYTHIACALGTATTVAGLLLAAPATSTVMGFCALKGMTDIDERLQYLLKGTVPAAQFLPVQDYSFGGYAKKDPRVFDFMNRLWQTHQLPTDFVYTAKMLYGVYDMAAQGFFPPGSTILCVHTGGLQGNRSLPLETLTF